MMNAMPTGWSPMNPCGGCPGFANDECCGGADGAQSWWRWFENAQMRMPNANRWSWMNWMNWNANASTNASMNAPWNWANWNANAPANTPWNWANWNANAPANAPWNWANWNANAAWHPGMPAPRASWMGMNMPMNMPMSMPMQAAAMPNPVTAADSSSCAPAGNVPSCGTTAAEPMPNPYAAGMKVRNVA